MLSREEAREFYNDFGARQDDQGHYEDLPLRHLIAQIAAGDAQEVCEFGCGTGRFAAELLAEHLTPRATYFGCDVSPTMIGLATERLEPFAARATLHLTDGAPRVPLADASVDRFLSTYVLDLLEEEDIRRLVAEAHRVLRPGGLLGVVGLTGGCSLRSRFIIGLWKLVHRVSPRRVGGCRPLELLQVVDCSGWEIVDRQVIVAASIPSEVVVLCRTNA